MSGQIPIPSDWDLGEECKFEGVSSLGSALPYISIRQEIGPEEFSEVDMFLFKVIGSAGAKRKWGSVPFSSIGALASSAGERWSSLFRGPGSEEHLQFFLDRLVDRGWVVRETTPWGLVAYGITHYDFSFKDFGYD